MSSYLPTNAQVYGRFGLTSVQIAELESPERITPLNRDREVCVPMLVNIIFDVPGRESDRDFMVEEFHRTILPELLRYSRRMSFTYRIAATALGSSLQPLWEGYRSLDELGPNPLSAVPIQCPKPGSRALYKAMVLNVLRASRVTKQFGQEGHRISSGMVIVMTDGADIEKNLDNCDLLRLIVNYRADIEPFLMYFKTDGGLDEAEFRQLAKSTGYIAVGYNDGSPRTDSQEKRSQIIRHSFRLGGVNITTPRW